jgi:glutathione peroxidase
MAASIYDFELSALGGGEIRLADHKGKVLLIVNTASECGFTPQYAGLEKLHQNYRDKGLVVIGCPCNQFGRQEPGSDGEIADFCHANYGVSFPMSTRIEVNGEGAHPLYAFLKSRATGVLGSESIKWNFTKFLVDRNGQVVNRFAPATKPEDLSSEIESLL